MSKARDHFKSALRSLDVSRPLRIPPQLAFKTPTPVTAALPVSSPEPSILGQSGSIMDRVHHGQGPQLTGSNFDPVHNEPSEPASERETPVASSGRVPFTAVPNFLLRELGRFSEPVDFMIYLHLFTYSHGFGRTEASMSVGQLERFTGVARNTVRRSLERLTAQGLIRCVGEFEHARMSRRYQVSIPDPVKIEPGPNLTRRGSKMNPVTGSNLNPYKESIHKEKSKNSLSQDAVAEGLDSQPLSRTGERALPAELQNYLENLKPERKRQSEQSALGELLSDFAAAEISEALTLVLERGAPGSGEPVHSPLAFLASGGITRALARVAEERRKREFAQQRRSAAEGERDRQAADDAAIEQEVAAREAAFVEAFPSREEQQQAVERYGARFPGLSPSGPVLRGLAIGAWWAEQGAGIDRNRS